MGKLRNSVVGVIGAAFLLAPAAYAQNVSTQDISQQLQSSLEASAPTIVYFGFDKDNITPESEAVLVKQATWLMQNPEAKVNLAGHTDAVGSNAYNDGLAMRRAKAVESFLFQKGVSPAQMQSVISRGEGELVVQTEKREQLNRRVTTAVTGLVEIFIQPDPTPVYVPPAPPARDPIQTETVAVNCPIGSGTELTHMTDLAALRGELQTRLDLADGIYKSEAALQSKSPRYNMAAFTKAECGVAIGFTKSRKMDERSVTNCACYSVALNNSQG